MDSQTFIIQRHFMANNSLSQICNPSMDISGKQVYITDTPRIRNSLSQDFTKVAEVSGNAFMNIFEIISSLSKPEQAFLTEMSKQFNWKEYLINMDFSTLTKAQKSNKYRTYKKLNKKNLVKRISKDIYLMNPRLLIPSDNAKEIEAKHLWDSIP